MKVFYFGNPDGLTRQHKMHIEDLIYKCQHTIICITDNKVGTRLSTLTNMPGQTVKELYFVINMEADRVYEIKDTHEIELMFHNRNDQVILKGKSKIITDMKVKQSKWQDWMNTKFPDGVEDKALSMLKFSTHNIKAMID